MKCNGTPQYIVIVYKKQTGAPDGIGGFATNWSKLGELRTTVTFSRSRDQVTGEVLQHGQDAKVMVPSTADVKQNDRVKISGVEYEVISVDPATTKSYAEKVNCYVKKVKNEDVEID